jgi:hypothetical protein
MGGSKKQKARESLPGFWSVNPLKVSVQRMALDEAGPCSAGSDRSVQQQAQVLASLTIVINA